MIFCSTHAYVLGQQLGIESALEEFNAQLNEPTNESLPVVKTITRLRTLDEVQLWIDPGSSRLAESRSRAFWAAYESGAEVWFSCDDDCEASLQTVKWMIEAVKDRSCICVAPYWCRLSATQAERISIQIEALPDGQLPNYRQLSGGGATMQILHGGFGLVAMSHRAMAELVLSANYELYVDKEGFERAAVFLEYILNHTWLGEDLAFFSRLPHSVSREALVTGHTVHAGKLLDLTQMYDLTTTTEFKGVSDESDSCPRTSRS